MGLHGKGSQGARKCFHPPSSAPTRASALTLDPGSVSTLIEFHGFGLLHGQLQRDESCWLLFLARISR